MFIFKPFIDGMQNSTYAKAFISGSVFATITAIFALHYDKIHQDKLKETNFCNNEDNFFCSIQKKRNLIKISLFIKTLSSSIIIYSFGFLLFGWGGGNIEKYYKPNSNDLLSLLKIIIFLVIFNFIVYYFILQFFYLPHINQLHHKKKNINILDVIRSIGFEYGLNTDFSPIESEQFKNEKKISETLLVLNKKYTTFALQNMSMLEKSKILNYLNYRERVKLFKKIDKKYWTEYLVLLTPKEIAKTIKFL